MPEKKDANIREIFEGEYRIIYQIADKEVRILTVVHGRRDLKKLARRLK